MRRVSPLVACSIAAFCGCGAPTQAPPEPPPPYRAEVAPVAMSEPPPALTVVEAERPTPSNEFDVGEPNEPSWREQKSTPRVRSMTLRTGLKKRWSAKVGKTTFRTTMALVGSNVVIGTHGATLDRKNEKGDGVYVVDARTGKLKSMLHTPGAGDLDVGGVAVDGDTVYFTTDNSQIVAGSLSDGKILWKAAAKGKVRPAPALADLSGDGHVDVIVGDEDGVLHALDGRTGRELWRAGTGVNDYGARGFVGACAIADLDTDGKDDVVAGSRDGILNAYRGKDGSLLWQTPQDSGIHASPSVADFDQDGRPEILAAWSYSRVAILDGRTGATRWLSVIEQDGGGIEGLFASPTPVPGAPGVLIAGTAWWGDEDGVIGVGVDARMFRSFEGRVSASAVVTDLDGDGTREAILGTEKGKLIALRADGGYAVLATLGGPIEATAMLADVDGDGGRELLVAANDQTLTLFDTGSTAKPDVARFRGASPHNRGELGTVRLGWRSARAARSQARLPSQPNAPPTSVRIDYLRCCAALTQAAGRAPSPENAELLRAAGACNSMAISAADRAQALAALDRMLKGKSTLPSDCR